MEISRPFRRGEFVVVTAHGRTKKAMVGLASPNGRSLILLFEGGLGDVADGLYIGSMPVLLEDDGVFRELINRRPITIERAP